MFNRIFFALQLFVLIGSVCVSYVYGGTGYGPHCECETIFGYDSGNPELNSCFQDLANDGLVTLDNKKRWGWSIGAYDDSYFTESNTLEWDLYAGAGQCDLDKGEIVGTIKFEYDINTNIWTMDFLADIDNHYLFTEFHVFVGNDILPTTNVASFLRYSDF